MSRIGKIIFLTLSLLDIAMPIGIPIITHITIPITTIVVVSIALSQKRGFKKPIKKVQKPTNIVVHSFLPLIT